jgi:hypothetical protein
MSDIQMRAGEGVPDSTDPATAPQVSANRRAANSVPQPTSHTALPWHVFDEAYPNHRYPGIEAAEGYSIVVWGSESDAPDQGVQGRTPEQARANAEFIVRACNNFYELLTAARRLASEFADDGSTCHAGIVAKEQCARCSQILRARAAVAKAESR